MTGSGYATEGDIPRGSFKPVPNRTTRRKRVRNVKRKLGKIKTERNHIVQRQKKKGKGK